MFESCSRTVVLKVSSCITTCASEFPGELSKRRLLSPYSVSDSGVWDGVQIYALLTRSQGTLRLLVQDLCNCNKIFMKFQITFDQFIPRQLIHLVALSILSFKNKIIYFFNSLLLEQKNTIDFCMAVFQTGALLHFKAVRA